MSKDTQSRYPGWGTKVDSFSTCHLLEREGIYRVGIHAGKWIKISEEMLYIIRRVSAKERELLRLEDEQLF